MGPPPHFLDRLLRHELVTGTQLPPATERLVGADKVGGDQSFDGCLAVLGLGQFYGGDVHTKKVGLAFLVLDRRQFERLLHTSCALGQVAQLLACPGNAVERGLDLRCRLQHGVLIVYRGLLVGRVLHADVVPDPAVVENRPAQCRADGPDEGTAVEEIVQRLVAGVRCRETR